MNQEVHHRREPLVNENKSILREFEIEFDEKYMF